MDIKQRNYKYPINRYGCCFCCDCYLAGLSAGHGIEGAFDYAVQNGWVRGSDSYVLDHNRLINGLSQRYGTGRRGGNRVNIGGHFVIKDGNGNTIYNPL